VATARGTELRPRLGRLLDGLYGVWSPHEDPASAVFLIDEINRGNAARIFGELITFLDADYRAGRPLTVPVPLPGLNADPGDPAWTEPVDRPSGDEVRLPRPWAFPFDAYFVATMNSVDRAAIPIDSALARRFERIELRPDLGLLAEWLGTDLATVEQAAESVRGPTASADAWLALTAEQSAVLLLDRINHRISSTLGEDFELGHALLRPVATAPPAERWRALALAWDDVIYPQIQERYVARPDQLVALLKLDEPPSGEPYAFRPRTLLGGVDQVADRVAPVRLSAVAHAELVATLRWLAV
jgi:5-methylcytosine-specific restriction protein B